MFYPGFAGFCIVVAAPLLAAEFAVPSARAIFSGGASAVVPNNQGLEVFGYCLPGSVGTASKGCHYPMLNRTGVGWVRNELAWSAIESTKGRYNFSVNRSFFDMGLLDYDGFTLGMKASGIKVLWILGGCGPDCTNPLYSPVDTPEGRSAFANFSAAAAQHFETLYPGGVALELWK